MYLQIPSAERGTREDIERKGQSNSSNNRNNRNR